MDEPGSISEGVSGRVVHLFLAQVSGAPMKPVAQATAIAARGFEGDRHARRTPGGNRQLLLVDARNLRDLDLSPGTLKENAVIDGLALESFPQGQRLRLGAVLVELTGPCEPCHKVEAIRPGLLRESWGRRGQLARVLEGGTLRVGALVEVLGVNPDAPKRVLPRLP